MHILAKCILFSIEFWIASCSYLSLAEYWIFEWITLWLLWTNAKNMSKDTGIWNNEKENDIIKSNEAYFCRMWWIIVKRWERCYIVQLNNRKNVNTIYAIYFPFSKCKILQIENKKILDSYLIPHGFSKFIFK